MFIFRYDISVIEQDKLIDKIVHIQYFDVIAIISDSWISYILFLS